jgi:hypothetical protein
MTELVSGETVFTMADTHGLPLRRHLFDAAEGLE